MNIKLEGVVKEVGDLRVVGQKGYTVRNVVIELVDGHQSQMIAIDFGGDLATRIDEQYEGATVTVDSYIDSRKWQDRWFTSLKARSFTSDLQPAPTETPASAEFEEDIPF